MADNSSKVAKYIKYKEKCDRRKKNIFKIFSIFVITIIIVGICGSVAYNSGFIPIKSFMTIKKPIGDSEEINIDEHIYKYQQLKDFPYIDKIKYKLYGTNRTLNAVANDYKKQLSDEGYKVLYEGVAYKDDISFQYYGFLKGITGVGIIITSDENITLNYETMVLYTTGNAFDYRDIFRWYKQNKDEVGDIYL
jgi:hypothetical protein